MSYSKEGPGIHGIPNQGENEASSLPPSETLSSEESHFLRYLVDRNPFLGEMVSDLFHAKKPVLLIGGESGMGKSLLTGVVRAAHAERYPGRKSELTVITWDRMNKMMYDQISIALGTTINPPDGEVPFAIRSRTAFALAKTVNHSVENRNPSGKILVESPFLFDRGEHMYEEFPQLRDVTNMVYMYSPQSRRQTMIEGRDTDTAGQLLSMTGMRKTIVHDIYGEDIPELADDEQEKIVEAWLMQKAHEVNAEVVRWNPHEIKELFESTRDRLRDQKISPDYMFPPSIGWYAMHELENLVKTIDNLEDVVFPN